MKQKIKLVIFDLDNTLTVGPTIWELIHKQTKTWESHGIPYLEQFKEGLFSFDTFIKKDVACWKGLSLKQVKKAISEVSFIPNIKKTVAALKKQGIHTALVSSSIDIFAEAVAKKFGIDHVFANPLGIANNKLTGKVSLKVSGRGKGTITKKLLSKLKVKKNEAIALGDSIFDMPMFKNVGTSITFTDADPDLRHQTNHIISKQDLVRILIIIERINK